MKALYEYAKLAGLTLLVVGFAVAITSPLSGAVAWTASQVYPPGHEVFWLAAEYWLMAGLAVLFVGGGLCLLAMAPYLAPILVLLYLVLHVLDSTA